MSADSPAKAKGKNAPSKSKEAAPSPLLAALQRRLAEQTLDNGQPVLDLAEAKRIGRVVSITGSQVVMILEVDEKDVSGELLSSLQMGSVIKIPTARSVVFAMISGLTIPMPAADPGGDESRLLEMELVGESVLDRQGNLSALRRGVSTSPALGSPVYAAGPLDLRFV